MSNEIKNAAFAAFFIGCGLKGCSFPSLAALASALLVQDEVDVKYNGVTEDLSVAMVERRCGSTAPFLESLSGSRATATASVGMIQQVTHWDRK